MSYSFWCSNCKKDHPGECGSRRWRWVTNYTVPDGESHMQEWCSKYFAGGALCEYRLGRPLSDGDRRGCDEKDLGLPETMGSKPYPAGAAYIPIEIWIAWQVRQGVKREDAERRANEAMGRQFFI